MKVFCAIAFGIGLSLTLAACHLSQRDWWFAATGLSLIYAAVTSDK